MREFIRYGIVGAIAGVSAAVIGNFTMPAIRVRDAILTNERTDITNDLAWNKPHEYLTYFFLGAFVCSFIAAMANSEKGPQVQMRSFLVGLLSGGVLCVAANSAVELIILAMARRISPDLMLTARQYSPLHDVGFLLYYIFVPFSLAAGLTLAVGVNGFTLRRGLVAGGLAAAISCILIHLALMVVLPVVLVQAVQSASARNMDLSGAIKALLIAHLFGMGLGAAIAFAVAQVFYKPAWLKGMNGWLEGRTLEIPSPVGILGCRRT